MKTLTLDEASVSSRTETEFEDVDEMLDSIREYMRQSTAAVLPYSDPRTRRLGFRSIVSDGPIWGMRLTKISFTESKYRMYMRSPSSRHALVDVLRLEVAEEKLQGSSREGQYTDFYVMMAAIRNHLRKHPTWTLIPSDDPKKAQYGYVMFGDEGEERRWFIQLEDLVKTGSTSTYCELVDHDKRLKATAKFRELVIGELAVPESDLPGDGAQAEKSS